MYAIRSYYAGMKFRAHPLAIGLAGYLKEQLADREDPSYNFV